MKQYLTGLVAIGLAISTFAFTNKPQKMINGKEVMAFSDPCLDVNKKWFMMSLDCNSQIQLSDLTTAGNYSMTTAQQMASTCTGTDCVCAIFACVAPNGSIPNIGTGTSIYTALSSFYNTGATSSSIAMKDQFWAR